MNIKKIFIFILIAHELQVLAFLFFFLNVAKQLVFECTSGDYSISFLYGSNKVIVSLFVTFPLSLQVSVLC